MEEEESVLSSSLLKDLGCSLSSDPVCIYSQWGEILYLGIMPNWSHCVGKADDQMNNSRVDAEILAFVPAQSHFCSPRTFVAGNKMT